ncbi:hypothetical protein Zmor_004142 [Zophobas morio]|uniref:Uncharacterized protein n=1 Tax=Zophobas morio TaxID=2755281 RepID=A0AA38HK44_9CUCU|nr:hypothetical protein Zmor_004142 [Zophobas morio]
MEALKIFSQFHINWFSELLEKVPLFFPTLQKLALLNNVNADSKLAVQDAHINITTTPEVMYCPNCFPEKLTFEHRRLIREIMTF